MGTSDILHSIRRTARNHGKASAFYDVVVRGLNKCLYYRILQCLVIETVDERCLALPPQFRFVKLEPAQLLKFSKNPANEITAEFVRSSVEKGDECFAILDGETLASYGWYSRRPTLLDDERLTLHFNDDYIYMYKGFTLAAYRGHRLHAIGMTRALAAYKEQGFKGLVSIVESNNFDSLRSCYRMGYHDCGQILVVGCAGRYFFRKHAPCEQYGFSVDRTAAA